MYNIYYIYIYTYYIYIYIIYIYVQEHTYIQEGQCRWHTQARMPQDSLLIDFYVHRYIYMKIKRHSPIPPYATMGQKSLHHTYCHCRNPQPITATIDLRVIQ